MTARETESAELSFAAFVLRAAHLWRHRETDAGWHSISQLVERWEPEVPIPEPAEQHSPLFRMAGAEYQRLIEHHQAAEMRFVNARERSIVLLDRIRRARAGRAQSRQSIAPLHLVKRAGT